MQRRPSILITGTPGVGKTTFAQLVSEDMGMDHINVAQLISDEALYNEWDEEMKCSIFDEERVADRLEELLASGGKVVDFHSCDFMRPSWFTAIFVLRAETHILYDRLVERNYATNKVQENVQAEIFQVLLEEAIETFGDQLVVELPSNTMQDLTANLSRVQEKLLLDSTAVTHH